MTISVYRYDSAPEWLKELGGRSAAGRTHPPYSFLNDRKIQWAVVKSGWTDWTEDFAAEYIAETLAQHFERKADGLQWDEKVLNRYEVVTFVAYE